MLNKTILRFFFLFFFILVPFWASAQVDPDIQWKIMRLPHFDLMYDAKHQELANLYADRLEDNIQALSQYYEFIPGKTVVVLDDRTDLTNGYATPIPYRTIVIYPVLPGPQETISDYGDWARELSMHEYAHVLSFEPRRGIVKGLYYTFGNIITPNLLLPRWWLEGVAVDMETRTSEKGRLRSPYQDGAIRAYVTESKLYDVEIDEINETAIHTWPQGSRPYLFGSLMWSEMIARHGKDLIKDLHLAYGGRVPYLIEAPVVERTGSDYETILNSTRDTLYNRVKGQLSVLEKTPFTRGTTLTVKNGVENFHPVISPDGLKMILLSKNDANKRSVRILVRPSVDVPFDGSHESVEIKQRLNETSLEQIPTPKTQLIQGLDEADSDDAPPGGTIQRLAWFPDSKRFIFDKLDSIDRYRSISDLHVFDISQMKIERMTRGERAREAGISPDSQTAVFVKLDAGRTHLGLLNLKEKSTRLVYSPPMQARISSPTYLNIEEIIFSERLDGREILKKINLASGQVVEVLPDYPDARFPHLTAKGLIFTSSRNGTSNLYLAAADLQTARPLTHSPTYISTSTWDDKRQEIYFSELTTEGFQIRQSASVTSNLPAELPKIEPLLADRYPAQKRDVPVVPKPEPEDYNPGPYLWPHYWLPNIYFYQGGAILGGSTSGSDPLKKHVYSLDVAYDTEPKDTTLAFVYMNNTTPATISLKALDYSTRILNTSFKFRQQLYEIDAAWELSAISTDLMAGFGYRWVRRDFEIPAGVYAESAGPTVFANYSDITMSGAQISPVSGQSARFAATHYLRGREDQQDFTLLEASLQKYFSKWLPRHNAILLRAQGQFIDRAVNIANAAITVPYNPTSASLSPYYIMRGYLNGQFLGRSLANYTFEYRFPISYPYNGFGTTPLFFKKVHGAFVTDAVTVDGRSFNKDLNTYERVGSWKSFWSVGAEIKFDMTIGYHIPLTLVYGVYQPLDPRYRDGAQTALSIQL